MKAMSQQGEYNPNKLPGRTIQARNQNTHNTPYFTDVTVLDDEGNRVRLRGEAAREYAESVLARDYAAAARVITRATEGTPSHVAGPSSCG
jgi:hypothetical protein